jgi:hypothetical protein
MTFDLAKAPDGLDVGVDLWEKAPTDSAYCNDIAPDTNKLATWTATKGKLTINIHEGRDPGRMTYKVSAKLEGVVFEDGAGNTATLHEMTISEATVGWYAG